MIIGEENPVELAPPTPEAIRLERNRQLEAVQKLRRFLSRQSSPAIFPVAVDQKRELAAAG